MHFGHRRNVIFASHHWPTWDPDNVHSFPTKQRAQNDPMAVEFHLADKGGAWLMTSTTARSHTAIFLQLNSQLIRQRLSERQRRNDSYGHIVEKRTA